MPAYGYEFYLRVVNSISYWILDIGRNWTLPLGLFRTNFTIFLLGETGRQLI